MSTMSNIDTKVIFGIPLGVTTVSDSLCKELKHVSSKAVYQGSPAEEIDETTFNVLHNNLELKKDIIKIFSIWANEVLKINNQKWAMTTNWITENTEGQAMLQHVHMNCMFSAVIYFDKTAEDHPPLELLNPHILDFAFLIGGNGTNMFNAESYSAPHGKGVMIMFPAFLRHGHETFKSKINRRSFACNFFPIGKFGYRDSTLDTNWLSYDE